MLKLFVLFEIGMVTFFSVGIAGGASFSLSLPDLQDHFEDERRVPVQNGLHPTWYENPLSAVPLLHGDSEQDCHKEWFEEKIPDDDLHLDMSLLVEPEQQREEEKTPSRIIKHAKIDGQTQLPLFSLGLSPAETRRSINFRPILPRSGSIQEDLNAMHLRRFPGRRTGLSMKNQRSHYVTQNIREGLEIYLETPKALEKGDVLSDCLDFLFNKKLINKDHMKDERFQINLLEQLRILTNNKEEKYKRFFMSLR